MDILLMEIVGMQVQTTSRKQKGDGVLINFLEAEKYLDKLKWLVKIAMMLQ